MKTKETEIKKHQKEVKNPISRIGCIGLGPEKVRKNVIRLQIEEKERKSFRGMESFTGCSWWHQASPIFIDRKGKFKGYMRN